MTRTALIECYKDGILLHSETFETIESDKYPIPEGRYKLTLHLSGSIGRWCPMLQGVRATPEHPSSEGKKDGFRSYILIHGASRPSDLIGCIGTTIDRSRLIASYLCLYEDVWITLA